MSGPTIIQAPRYLSLSFGRVGLMSRPASAHAGLCMPGGTRQGRQVVAEQGKQLLVVLGGSSPRSSW